MDYSTSDDAMENLYPALAQCFAIIIAGYLAGRCNLVSETESKGIRTFVSTFSLPSLIFMSMAQLDFSKVNWSFLLSILLAKGIIFLAVIVVTLMIRRPLNYGRAGLFAIFCTQSNDFAIGYPIVSALYKKTHPDYASYIYLMAPISLAILNPFAFVLLEIGKRQNVQEEIGATSTTNYFIKLIISVANSIFLNPVVFMTVLGIAGNFLFKHKVPCLLGEILDVMGGAFSATALFLLGLSMVGKVHKLKGATLILPGVLIIVKLLFLPITIREIISTLHSGSNVSDTSDLSTYGFLYGTFPTAPAVFVFASQYSLDVDLIASAMVACTFMSAPLMYVSAKMITLTKTDPSTYLKQLNDFTFDISIVGMVCGLWVFLVLFLTKKVYRVPQRITATLVVSQVLSCLGAVLWNSFEQKQGFIAYFQFVVYTVGVYSSRLWTAFLSLSLLFLKNRSLCFILKLHGYFSIAAWGVPLLLSALFLIFDQNNSIPYDKRNPNFVYGAPQAIVTISLLIMCFIITVGSLILHQRYTSRYSRYMSLANDVSSVFEHNNEPILSTEDTSTSTITDIEDLAKDNHNRCPSGATCAQAQGQSCTTILQYYENQTVNNIEYIEEEPEFQDPQILSHIVLLIFLLCSMFVGLALSVWTLIMEQMSGIYVEMCFLDATLNFGQSIIVFAIFGLNTKEILLPILYYWKKMSFGMKKLTLPTPEELDPETKQICEQFKAHHLENCRRDIAKDKRWRLKVYKNVFTGKELVEWLIEYGLARDRVEAVNYGGRLVDGKVMTHINQVYHFYDRNLLYTLD